MKTKVKNRLKTIILWSFSLMICMTNAQNSNVATIDSNDIPENIKEILKAVPKIDIYNIGVEVLQDSIIVADKVVFNEGAVASLNDFNWSRLIIYADELVFANPRLGAQILRKIDAKAPIPPKPKTPKPQPNAGRNGSHGNHGAKGTNGTTGLKGRTLNIPDIWIITNKLVTPKGIKISSNKLNLRIFVPGINGSDGGDGGNGGKGGDGGTGRHGSCRLGFCSRGPGNGGNGGQGGSGGRAGDGGDGGNGGNVYFVGPKKVIDVLQFTSIQNNGADAGLAGLPGQPGTAGHGGARGSRPCNCSGGRVGSNGSAASPSNLGQGMPGLDGKKGKTTAYIIPDIKALIQ